MDDLIFFWLYYLYFLLFIGPFHLIAWSIRFFTRKGKDAAYIETLTTYIRSVGIYLLGFLAIIPVTTALYFPWIGMIYLALAGGFPLYYWKNIFYPGFKKKRLIYDY